MAKCVRGDIWYYIRLEGIVKYISAFVPRLASKVIADFSGCLHMRHAYEMGGIAFSASMVWAQIMPFVALQFYEGSNKDALTTILACSASLWLLFNIVFFRTINKSYYNTFFGTMTGPQYACKVFLKSNDDTVKFYFAFETLLQYTKSIEAEVKEWVANNIDRWKVDKPERFKIELIPDEFLPQAVLVAEGGANRKRFRSNVSLREMVGLEERKITKVHPQQEK